MEDVIWLLIQVLIFTGALNVPELVDDKLVKGGMFVAVVFTSQSVIISLLQVGLRSYSLNEEFLQCLMSMMTANTQWLPYEQQIIKGTLT